MSRPNIAYSVNKVSQYLQQPTISHWQACKRVLRYLKGTSNHDLCFTPAASNQFVLEGFTTADWASNIDDRKSTGGYCFYLGSNLITWSAQKQSTVSKSSTEPEYRALAKATTEVLWLMSLFSELGIQLDKRGPPIIW